MASKAAAKVKAEANGTVNRSAEHLKGLEEATAPGAPIRLPKLQIKGLRITVRGTSSLITHKFSQKAKQAMLDKQTGAAKAGRAKKNPDNDYRESLYVMGDGSYGFPSLAFKSAAVDACTSLGKSVTKTQARQAFHVLGEFVSLGGKPVMREDVVRLNGTTADIRFRAEFLEWTATFDIRYNSNVLTAEEIVNMFNVAGFAVGVGEWRPERNGNHGMFEVVGK